MNYILLVISFEIFCIMWLLCNIRKHILKIRFHLNGIETKEIISLGNEPRILTRSDEDEYNISHARKPKPEKE